MDLVFVLLITICIICLIFIGIGIGWEIGTKDEKNELHNELCLSMINIKRSILDSYHNKDFVKIQNKIEVYEEICNKICDDSKAHEIKKEIELIIATIITKQELEKKCSNKNIVLDSIPIKTSKIKN